MTNNNVHNFEYLWYREKMGKTQAELRRMEESLESLKNHGTSYYNAHVIVIEMLNASLEAMSRIPVPENKKEPTCL